ncbi:pentatricopeptide repeat-containing protein At1g30610, chloroplastic-like isoform X2 [Lolium rigidum]|uniref:pentatricopeptide repeat-containing protein At1g30610, chloroplastic-like isoform X2 n=1 Tax=Lolium rigidum TaxID=89674 RepID=UPI001F5D8039|nr:pentatricopeptide repeat-containing protein At1g30610, chloroplastic-like isoform X2 [Lolium rigidum]
MAAAPPNASMGLLNLGGSGVLLPSLQSNSCPRRGFLVPRRDTSVSWGLVRRGRVLDPRSGAAGALASSEAGAGSSELRHIEKELTFSPTFTDYVKMMESVKLDRSKSFQGGDSDGRSPRRRFAGDGDASAGRRVGRESADPRDKSFERKRGALRDRGRSAMNDSAGLVGKRMARDAENGSDGHQRNVQEYVQRRIVRGERSEFGGATDNNGKQFAPFERKRGAPRDRGGDQGRRERSPMDDSAEELTGLVGKRMARDAEDSGNGQGKVEEYVQRRIVRGERRKFGVSTDNNDRSQFAPYVKTKDTSGSMVARESPGNMRDQSNARKDLQGRATSAASRTSVTRDSSIIFTNSTINKGREDFTNARSSPRERQISNSEVNADSNFQRYQHRKESSRRDLVDGRFRDNDMDYSKPTVSKRYSNTHTVSENYGHRSDSFQRGKPETIRMQRGENVQPGKFVRRDSIDDRAAFKTFEAFTDVRNRPRALQMEIEEKIQKLASRLNATDVNTPEWKFSKMIHDAEIKFTDHSILRVVQILGRYGNWKRVLQVVEWLQSRERFKSDKSRYIYTTVLDVLGKAKRPFEALNVFYTMLDQLSSYPDIAAYHCIAVTLGQAGLVKELFDVIDCMRSPPRKKFMVGHVQNWDPRLEPDLIVYNAVLNSCVQQKQWEGTFWVLQQLKEKNIRPTNTTYGLVMEAMLVCGKYNLVYEFFDRVKQKSIPGALNYKVLVNALWREGKIDEAVMAVKDMENRGIVGSASLYYDLARCLCSGGRSKEALLQVEKICKVAKKPLVVTYTGLIQTCIDSGSMENAKYIFNEMCNYCSPNNVTCNIMLKSYIDHGMFEDAKNLLENILSGRIQSKGDSGQQAIADKFTFNTFMDACAEAKKWNDFEYAFRKMLSNGYHFEERRHLRMVLDAYRNGKEQLLEDVWDYLCRHGRVPPAPMIMERFCLKLRQGDTATALSCITSFQESKIHTVSSMSWFNLLNRNSDRLKEESIVNLVHELKNELAASGSSCGSLYQNVLSSCTEFLSGGKTPSDGHIPLCNS